MSHPLPGPLAHAAPLLDRYGYAVVAIFAFVEGFGVPVPAVTVLVAAAVYAGAGHLSVAGVAAVAVVGAILGDNVGYGLGRLLGRPAVLRWGHYVGLTEARVRRAEGFLCRGGGNIVVVARFIDGLRQTVGLVAGTVGMPWRRYFVRDAIGGVLWVGAWLTLGYLTGEDIGRVYPLVTRYFSYLVAAAVVLVAGVAAWHLWRRHRHAVRTRRPAA
ncbi:DedA family protein [Planosporangium sp. 12N6]|uniref:DedA family protein n=1 Tax=Planosporangium spinosum TaxID=3402278 RepID=UPI003CE6D3CC